MKNMLKRAKKEIKDKRKFKNKCFGKICRRLLNNLPLSASNFPIFALKINSKPANEFSES